MPKQRPQRYGDGTYGYDDSVDDFDKLQPLNPYGWSKHNFDLWVKEQNDEPPFWAGFKFFNVYGPNEYHKGPNGIRHFSCL